MTFDFASTFDITTITAAFLLGLLSSAHCIGMCGGIMGALSMAIPQEHRALRWWILFSYNLGRILSYAVIGLLLGGLVEQLVAGGGLTFLRWLAGLLLIAMGLYLADWWKGLIHLEKAGRYLWVYIQPLGKKLMPVDSTLKALLLGFIWGWLPCGLVYSALTYAVTSGSAVGSASLMLAFGLGTLPSVLLSGVLVQELNRWLQIKQLRWAMAILIILFGVWTLWGGGAFQQGHQHHHTMEMPQDQTDMGHHDHSIHEHNQGDHSMHHSDIQQDSQSSRNDQDHSHH